MNKENYIKMCEELAVKEHDTIHGTKLYTEIRVHNNGVKVELTSLGLQNLLDAIDVDLNDGVSIATLSNALTHYKTGDLE